MLYVKMKINNVDVQAFIDTGAQSTIISLESARQWGIMKYVDTRFQGRAVGVGSCTIVGRIHALDIYIGEHKVTCSIQVLDAGNMKFLFGLDSMKKHRVTFFYNKKSVWSIY